MIPTAGRPLRSYLALAFGVMAAVPALALALVLTYHHAEERRREAAENAHHLAASLAQTAGNLVEEHRRSLVLLAQTLEGRDLSSPSSGVADELRDFQEIYPGFCRLRLLRQATPLVVISTEEADSEARTITLRAPLLSPPDTHLEGTLDLRIFQRLTPLTPELEGLRFVLLGPDEEITFAYRIEGTDRGTDEEATPSLPETETGQFLVARSLPAEGWKAVVRFPMEPMERLDSPDYLFAGLWLLGAVALSFGAAQVLARRVTRPLESLVQTVRHFQINGKSTTAPSSGDAPAEVQLLFHDFEDLAQQLGDSYRRLQESMEEGGQLRRELEKVLASQEDEIRDRTAELEMANRELERLASLDGLTGIANHRRFIDALDQAWRIAVREKKSMAVLMIDLDHFKAYNDTYGHQRGDDCLRKVAREIHRAAQRPLDIAARYGGEEFGAVLYDTDREVAMQLAEKIRKSVEDLGIEHSGSPFGWVTPSIGVAATVPRLGEDPADLVAFADRALYSAKQAGRNRVRYFEGREEEPGTCNVVSYRDRRSS